MDHLVAAHLSLVPSVAERMEGAYQPDFYGPYLEGRLDKARQAIRRQAGGA